MKKNKIKLSIKIKITLWFSVLILLITGIVFAMLYTVSDTVLKNDVREALRQIVRENADEVGYYGSVGYTGRDQYIKYGSGYIVIDDDFCDFKDGIYTALYDNAGTLLYGENPLSGFSDFPVDDGALRSVIADGEKYYVFDLFLTDESLDGLRMRGIASEKAGTTLLGTMIRWSLLLIPVFVIAVILSGYFLIRRCLKPIDVMNRTAEDITGGTELSRRIRLAGDGGDELHRLADSFNGMLDRLEASFERERQFTSDVSHELRTPTAVILARSEYSLENDSTKEDFTESMKVVDRQGHKLSDLISQLLSFLRLGQDSGFTCERLDLSKLINEVCEENPEPARKNIFLKAEIEPGIMLSADRTLMIRLADNLIGNACRYGKTDGHIKVALYESDGKITFSVDDDGIGIAPENLEKIWDRFFRVDKSRNNDNGSMGLGLPMVKQIASLHGGSVSVKSTLDVGSTFTVVFPINK